MTRHHTVRINHRQEGKEYTLEVPNNNYILHSVEEQGNQLPCLCRNGAYTTCAVRILSGEVYQPEAVGLSPELKDKGYALLCVSYARSSLEIETQNEDEVYEIQFGQHFRRVKKKFKIFMDDD
ncbi:2Fe-2S iron-sulfur cluster-binding protein [cyanobacterium endosymbiont of Epithemia clementina EcSB]|uniref:2Fe-2S iron-sulfur cluster-binding protein n=1 Tax=cyanobacterium endosymbiont of Epithemia clementina EcSB TaxID=3034674 RepID=UPI002480CE76|nr:2Fe-2S iron-sulfur cluster-binding protein [cyanobacterium endosymbiont of Epithemia clementina EcSB]WGT68486.1 2Fe-2S iron-sulfur cluster-binding protein [cyanobacterium endosymbiont of Epithemia clementina EcSB]